MKTILGANGILAAGRAGRIREFLPLACPAAALAGFLILAGSSGFQSVFQRPLDSNLLTVTFASWLVCLEVATVFSLMMSGNKQCPMPQDPGLGSGFRLGGVSSSRGVFV